MFSLTSFSCSFFQRVFLEAGIEFINIIEMSVGFEIVKACLVA